MTWFAFRGYGNGKAVDIAGTQEKQAVILGFHGYATEKEAESHPNDVAGFFPDPVLGAAQKEFVNAIIKDYGFAKRAGEQPGGPNANILNPANDLKGDAQAAGSFIPGLGALDAAFRQLTKASMWRSLGWLLLGGAVTGAGIFWWAKTEGTRGVSAVARGKKPELTAPVLPLILMITGLYLMWFGVKYWEDTKTVWPSDPVKAILQGKGLPARAEDVPAAVILNTSEMSNQAQSGNTGSGTAAVPAHAAGPVQDQARNLLSSHHWNTTELVPLISLWNQESGWNPKARNPSSGAYGIPQALGHGVPGGAANDGTNEYGGFGLTTAQAKAANSGMTYWQIVWGLNYIADTYGSPSAAWAHEKTHNWY